ncbi:DUF2797 domain-containing protein [Streptomyces sp. NBC_00028]|uniref:DUF2797 domain-containing protein n=1 Tax=Streptomyces sp. NBC_00028 TaxID=2975624 RepID=UPI003247434B
MSQAPPTSGTYVCHGVTWATGDPRLLLAPLPDGPLLYAEIMNQRIGYRATGGDRWCTGWYRFTDTHHVEATACPNGAHAGQSGQCVRCAGRDDFHYAHRYHQGGPAPEALAAYMAQPHWLYLATFADGTTKVGTAAEPRKHSRLAEQGALVATFLTSSPDGRTVRFLEDALTRHLGLTQAVRAAAKLNSLAAMSDLAPAQLAHKSHLDSAVAALDAMNVTATPEPWTPPGQGDLLRGAERVLYPHDVREGEHGLTPVACIGSQVLAALDGDELRYLLDLGALKGRRLTFGAYTSPSTAVQSALF